MSRPTLISLFSGGGGLDIGLEDAGFVTVLANEVEPYACETLRQNRILSGLAEDGFEHWLQSAVLTQRCHSGVTELEIDLLRRRLRRALKPSGRYLEEATIVERDVRQLPAHEILEITGLQQGDLYLLAGGPPCQPFSRSGKKELVDCDTGQLFLEFVRLVDGLRPRWFLFENVKGLVIHKADIVHTTCDSCGTCTMPSFNSRETLKTRDTTFSFCVICDMETEHTVEWRSKRAGSLDIIQSEFERIGYRCHTTVLNAADFGAPQSRERVFIVGSRDGERFVWPDSTHEEYKDGSQRIATLFDHCSPRQQWQTVRKALYSTGHWKYGDLNPHEAVLWVKNVVRPHDEPVTWSLDRIAPTVGAHQSAKLAIAPHGVPPEQLARQQWHVLGRRQGDTPPVFVEHEYLTDVELLKLQTFPDSWYLHGTRMHRAFQIGNAVPPVLATAVGQAILKASAVQPAIERGSYVAHASSF